MKKITYPKVDLLCILQESDNINHDQCHNGIISLGTDGNFRFEEALHKGTVHRNPKLYDGNHISMVRMSNGKYKFHMKAIPCDFDRIALPAAIYQEVIQALKIID